MTQQQVNYINAQANVRQAESSAKQAEAAMKDAATRERAQQFEEGKKFGWNIGTGIAATVGGIIAALL